MRHHITSYLFLLWASVANAFDYPSLHSVVGVAADDFLNVREGPDVSLPVIAKLMPTATGVEIIKTTDDGRWGLVNVSEKTGWTAMRYLKKTANPTPNTQCFGTEPFWSSHFSSNASFGLAGEPQRYFQITANINSTNRTDRFATVAQGPSGQLIATISAKQCSDGMSDRLYGLSVEMLVENAGKWTQFSGCCLLTE